MKIQRCEKTHMILKSYWCLDLNIYSIRGWRKPRFGNNGVPTAQSQISGTEILPLGIRSRPPSYRSHSLDVHCLHQTGGLDGRQLWGALEFGSENLAEGGQPGGWDVAKRWIHLCSAKASHQDDCCFRAETSLSWKGGGHFHWSVIRSPEQTQEMMTERRRITAKSRSQRSNAFVFCCFNQPSGPHTHSFSGFKEVHKWTRTWEHLKSWISNSTVGQDRRIFNQRSNEVSWRWWAEAWGKGLMGPLPLKPLKV